MNEFASTQDSGILKEFYGDENMTPLQIALKRKMLKMSQTLKDETILDQEEREQAMTGTKS